MEPEKLWFDDICDAIEQLTEDKHALYHIARALETLSLEHLANALFEVCGNIEHATGKINRDVPVSVVAAVIERHGGLVLKET